MTAPKTGDDREAYWNASYLSYWKDRVAESAQAGESAVVAGDAKTESDEIYRGVFDTHGFAPGSLLDVGCAWGRMFDLYLRRGLRVSGVDISSVMIEEAAANWANNQMVDRLEKATAEKLPFEDGAFDNLSCFATFDATHQHEALSEFLRVVRPGGRIYLTGKNTRYRRDDKAALAAENGARSKGHPNHFTDTARMLAMLRDAGHGVLAEYYFQRRGDFAAMRADRSMPDRFYEYLLVLEPQPVAGPTETLAPFANAFSETFRDLEQKPE